MLQAYIDESCTDGVLFVMAGYVATDAQWTDFSNEWSDLLRLGPPNFRRISEFHMVEMADSPLSIEQSELFYRVIEKHLTLHVSCSIKIADLRAAFDSIKWPNWVDNLEILINEHYSAFETIVKGLATEQKLLGIRGPVDIYFDNHSNKAKCLKAWNVLKHYGPPEVRAVLGETPAFRDSATTMPLQAADMLAYWIRKCQLEPDCDYGRFALKFPWSMASKEMKGLHVFYTPEMIQRNYRNALLALQLERAGVSPHIVTAVVSPVEKLPRL